MGFDGSKVRPDVWIVIGRAQAAEQLWDAEFAEVAEVMRRAASGYTTCYCRRRYFKLRGKRTGN